MFGWHPAVAQFLMCWFIKIALVGVADGVGGWASAGVDPSKFSTALMKACKVQAVTADSAGTAVENPIMLAFKSLDPRANAGQFEWTAASFFSSTCMQHTIQLYTCVDTILKCFQ